ncbi:hypothetical protein EPO44_02600, partial [bacterium]
MGNIFHFILAVLLAATSFVSVHLHGNPPVTKSTQPTISSSPSPVAQTPTSIGTSAQSAPQAHTSASSPKVPAVVNTPAPSSSTAENPAPQNQGSSQQQTDTSAPAPTPAPQTGYTGPTTGYVMDLHTGGVTTYTAMNDYDVWVYNHQNQGDVWYWTTDKVSLDSMQKIILDKFSDDIKWFNGLGFFLTWQQEYVLVKNQQMVGVFST